MAVDFLEALGRALQDAFSGYYQFQTRIRPALEEEWRIGQRFRAEEEERRAAAAERERAAAARGLQLLHAIYGGPEGIPEEMLDRYLNKVEKAYGVRLPTVEEEVLAPGRIRRPTGRPRLVRELPQPEPVIPPPPPGPFRDEGPPRVEEPEYEEVEGLVPTGEKRRRLVIPERPQEPTVDTPIGRLTLTQLKQVPETLLKRWYPDPDVRARLELDIAKFEHDAAKARFDQAVKIADDQWRKYQHFNPSAAQQAQLALQGLAQRSLDAYRQGQLALQQGHLDSLNRWRNEQINLQRAALAIRRDAIRQRAGVGQVSFSELRNYYETLLDELNTLRAQPLPTPEVQAQIKDLEDEARNIQGLLRQRIGRGGASLDVGRLRVGETAPTPLQFGTGVVGRSLAGPPLTPRPVREPIPTPPPAITVPGRPALPALPAPGRTYQTRHSGTMTRDEVARAIQGMVARGISRDRIRQVLADNGIPPQDFGY